MQKLHETPIEYNEQGFTAYQLTERKIENIYKLRINISDDDYTNEIRKNISEIIIKLNKKYSTEDCAIVTQFKFFTKNRSDVASGYDAQTLKFWQALKKNDRGTAEEIAENIKDPIAKAKYQGHLSSFISEYVIDTNIRIKDEVLNSSYRFVGQGQFTLHLALEDVPNNFTDKYNLGLFIAELNQEIKRLNIKSGSMATTDTFITPHVSFRQELLNGVYIAHNDSVESLAKLKVEQDESNLFKFFRDNIQNQTIPSLSFWNKNAKTIVKGTVGISTIYGIAVVVAASLSVKSKTASDLLNASLGPIPYAAIIGIICIMFSTIACWNAKKSSHISQLTCKA